MLPTPSTSHVDTHRIYEPSEDSFLFLDTLSSTSEIEYLTQRFGSREGDASDQGPPVVLEVGTGSGVILAFLCAQAEKLFGRSDVLAFGSDVNRLACEATQETVRRACTKKPSGGFEMDKLGSEGQLSEGQLLAIMQADLASPFRPGMVDVLLFNPPYVPSEEVPPFVEGGVWDESHLLSLSYAGGKEGMEVTNRLLGELPDVLNKERGVAYILLCHQNRPEVIMKRIRNWGLSWSADIVGKSGKQAGWEKLVIMRVSRNNRYP